MNGGWILIKRVQAMTTNVDFEKIIDGFKQYGPLSPGLRNSLLKLLTLRIAVRGELILKMGKKPDRLWFLVNGFAKEISSGEKAKRISWFYLPGDLMNSYPSFFNQLPAFRDIEMITKGAVIEVLYRDLVILRQEFEEMNTIIDLARDHCEIQRARYASRMHTLSAKERYDKFYSEHPILFNVAKHKDITSFLGIKADSFSRFYKG